MKEEIGKNNLISEDKEVVPEKTVWVKKEGLNFSALELQNFGRFLMARPEHRKGDMTSLQTGLDKPLEVRFFSDDPKVEDDVYHIQINYKTRSFEVTKAQGRYNKIEPLLEEFGFTPVKGK